MQVIVQQPADRGIGFGWIVGGGQRAGVLAEQVVQLVAAGCGLGEQMLIVEACQVAARLIQAGFAERGGGVGVDARAGDQAEPAEQPLLAGGEVGVGQVERRRDG